MSDPKDIRKRAEQIARDLLEGLDAPDDPNQEAIDAQVDREKSAIFEAGYVKSGKKKPRESPTFAGPARTAKEMRFAASLEHCKHCNARELDELELELRGGGNAWTYTGHCQRCKNVRSFSYRTEGDPGAVQPDPFELGPGPSKMITPRQFLDELAEVVPLIAPEPARLKPKAWHTSIDAALRALMILNELIKLAPAGSDRIPSMSNEPRATRAWLEQERPRLQRLYDKNAAERQRIWALEHP